MKTSSLILSRLYIISELKNWSSEDLELEGIKVLISSLCFPSIPCRLPAVMESSFLIHSLGQIQCSFLKTQHILRKCHRVVEEAMRAKLNIAVQLGPVHTSQGEQKNICTTNRRLQSQG